MFLTKTDKIGYMFAFMAVCCYALLGIISRVPLGNGLSPIEVAFWRALFGSAFFIAHGVYKDCYKVNRHDLFFLVLFGFIGIGIFFICFQMAVQKGGAALASVLLYTAPFWVMVMARIFFKEYFTWRKSLALVAAIGGVTLLCLSGGGLPDKVDGIGIVAGLLAGMLYSLQFIFSKHFLQKMSAITIYMYCMPIGALAILPFIEFSHKTATDWGALISLGAICTYMAYMTYCMGLKHLSAGKMAVFCSLEPFITTLLAVVIWSEMFSPTGWVGMIFVMSAVFMVMLEKKE